MIIFKWIYREYIEHRYGVHIRRNCKNTRYWATYVSKESNKRISTQTRTLTELAAELKELASTYDAK